MSPRCPKTWFLLVDGDGNSLGPPRSVHGNVDTVEELQIEIKNTTPDLPTAHVPASDLRVFRSYEMYQADKTSPLDMHASLEGIVTSFQSCLVVQVPSWFNKRWFVLVDGDGNDVGAERFVSAQVTNVAGFLGAVSRLLFGELLSGAAQFDLEVFGTRASFNADHLDPLVPVARLADLGSTKDSALVVRMSPRCPKTWFLLVDGDGNSLGPPRSVHGNVDTVEELQIEIKNTTPDLPTAHVPASDLRVFRSYEMYQADKTSPLDMHASLEGIVTSFQSCLVVQVPSWFNKRWFVLVDGDGNDVGAERFVSAQVTNVAGFLGAVSRLLFGELLSGAAQFDLEVFGTRASFNADHLDPLVPVARLADLGSTKDSALVVRMSPRCPKTWFLLVDGDGNSLGPPRSVHGNVDTVEELQIEIKNTTPDLRTAHVPASDLRVFRSYEMYQADKKSPLDMHASLEGIVSSSESCLVVQVPSLFSKRWFRLVDNRGQPVCVDTEVEVFGNFVCHFQQALKAKFANTHFSGVPDYDILLFANGKEYSDSDRHPLEPSTELGDCGLTKETCLAVPVPARLSNIGGNSAEAQMGILLSKLEWKDPEPLCSGPGSSWPFQGTSELAQVFVNPLADHYHGWLAQDCGKTRHELPIIVGGSGTGKSRVLDNVKNILKEAAKLSGIEDLSDRMKQAVVFKVRFGGNTPVGATFNRQCPEFEISCRMLYQLTKEKLPWESFVARMLRLSCDIHLQAIEMVMTIVAKLMEVEEVRRMSVILCIDELEQLSNNDSLRATLGWIIRAIGYFHSTSRAFAVCVCSTAAQMDLEQAMVGANLTRTYLIPPRIDGDMVPSMKEFRSPLVTQLMRDLGGHARSIEALLEVLHGSGDLLNWDSPNLPSGFTKDECQRVLIAILSRKTYTICDKIDDTELPVDTLRRKAMCWLTRDGKENFSGRIDSPFVVFQGLLHGLSPVDDSFRESLRCLRLGKLRFDELVVFHRRIKSLVFANTHAALAVFHSGAHFCPDSIGIAEPGLRRLDKKSTSKPNVIGLDASDNEIVMQAKLTWDVQVKEVIRWHVGSPGETLNWAAYKSELTKANVRQGVDVFVFITTARVKDPFDLPSRCGLVTFDDFDAFFGPLAGRVVESVGMSPTTPSYHQQLVDAERTHRQITADDGLRDGSPSKRRKSTMDSST